MKNTKTHTPKQWMLPKSFWFVFWLPKIFGNNKYFKTGIIPPRFRPHNLDCRLSIITLSYLVSLLVFARCVQPISKPIDSVFIHLQPKPSLFPQHEPL